MVVNTFRAVTRWMVLLSVAGIALGIVGYVAIEWTIQSIEAGGVAADFAPLVAVFVTLLVAPVLTAVIGLSEGRRATDRRVFLETAVGSLIGSVLYVIIAVTLTSRIMAAGAGPGLFDIVSIAGLIAITGVLTAIVGGAVVFAPDDEVDAPEQSQTTPLPKKTDSTN
ncbi:hypothetical protein ACFO5R_20835 [Halosolutus amylolyticus]|uniref:DUF2975 domain-containing protein n=1 Tax=Halosolutus amylolyticus TaxID=2932267 RepID=A0ABD5PWM5_9EURY|nr:hypothetical protein [Halosolutus amylolyticus]